MSMNIFDAFGPVDDLIQVIYQGSHRFVLLSHVEFDSTVPGWLVHVGLADKGRWWRGRWEERDVDEFMGKNVSSDLLEAFADKVAKMVTSGELFVEGIDNSGPRPDTANMKIVLGPHETRPLKIPLKELEREEAVVFVTNEFFELGLNAQKRKCKLNPPAFQPITTSAAAPVAPVPRSHHHHHHEERERYRRRSPEPSSHPAKKSRKTSVSPSRQRSASPPPKTQHTKTGRRTSPPQKTIKEKSPVPPETSAATAKPKPKIGPAKRARKVQNMEFADDDD